MPNYQLAAERAARKYNINPAIFKAMIRQESGFNPNARSGKGAQGIAQFIPSTAKSYGVNLNDSRVTDDLEGAARYLADNLRQFGGNYSKALAAYNAGSGAVQKYGGVPPFRETQNYVKSILAAARQGSSGSGGKASQGASGTRTTTTTRTVGGVDNSAARRAAIVQFLNSSGKGGQADPVNLAVSLKSLADVPGQKVTTSRRTGTTGSAGAGGTSRSMGPLRELFWQGQGGVDVKNGVKEPQGFVSGHQDHVHVASGPKTVRQLGRLAQQMGLHVGENPAFGGVHPVHVKGSYHYKGEAIDVSGPPKLMAHFAAVVAHKYGIKVRN